MTEYQKEQLELRQMQIKYGSMYYTLPDTYKEKNDAYTKAFNAGEGFKVGYDTFIYRTHGLCGTIKIGKNVIISDHCVIDYSGYVEIGNNVHISDGVKIYSHKHPFFNDPNDPSRQAIPVRTIIKEGAHLEAGCIILPGISIGKGATVYPGAVVIEDVNDYQIVVGNPARDLQEVMKGIINVSTHKETKTVKVLPIQTTQDVNRLKNEIIEILQDVTFDKNIDSKESLITNHVLDSIAVISLVSILSDKFNIKIPYYEINHTNFDSVDSIVELVLRQKKGSNADTGDNNSFVDNVVVLEKNNEYNIERCNSLVEYIKQHSDKNPQKVAVVSQGQEYTYSELFLLVQKYSAFLSKKGLKKGDIVVVKVKQSIEYIIIYLSVHLCSAAIVPIEKNASDERVIEIVNETAAAMLISDSYPEINMNKTSYINSSKVLEDIKLVTISDYCFPNSDDTADILFTTGTTGKSKGVELSHRAVLAGADNIAFGCEMKKETVLIVPNPLSHSNALKNMGACFITGCTFYILDGITDLKALFNALDYKNTRVSIVLPPSAIRTLFQLAKEKFGEYSERLDYLMAATAPLPEPDRDELRKMFPNTRLYNHYGCSESSSICIYDFNEFSELKNCVGKVMPHSKVVFVNDDREIIMSSSTNYGLLAVSGDATMKGYFNSPELTKEILVNETIYTNDIGYIDEEGFVFIMGRCDDIINVGGLKVSPTEIESVALIYSEIVDCICIGVDDKITGKSLKLLVVPNQNYDRCILQKILVSKLIDYQVPKLIEEVDKIERTYNGKLNRKYYKII